MAQPRKLIHISHQTIRWGDMDAYEHVNNTIYFRYMEQARVEWLEAVGYRCNARQEAPVIVHADCSFLLPLSYPGIVEVRMFAGHPGRSSLVTFYELCRQGDDRLYAEGSAKIVWIDPASGKSVSLPEALRRLAAG
ncbi:MAG: acyl-CoA thioesterase [Gammaproteobacteria bacterium]|nr:acyl-CoA thioesterase [Gammaproteobacteria bacterium]